MSVIIVVNIMNILKERKMIMKRSKSKKTLEKWEKISEIILKTPGITLQEIENITGIPKSTISRLCRDNNSNKKDMRIRTNLINSIREELKNEISDS